MQQLDGAAADFRKACALKPKQYNAYLNLAHVYLARSRVLARLKELVRSVQEP